MMRVFGLDVLRAVAFLAILIFHVSFALKTTPPAMLEIYGRLFAFSGFAVLFISFFLFGFRSSSERSWLRKIALLGAFAIVWTATAAEWPYLWDIYPFLICTLIGVTLIDRLHVAPLALAMLGGILISLPLWQLEGLLAGTPLLVKAGLLGACSVRSDLGDWPVFPWIGWPLFAFGVGRLAKRQFSSLTQMRAPEFAIWIGTLGATTLWLGNYYVTPLGEEFGCYMFRQPPLTFWAHSAWFLFLVRASLLTSVQEFLGRSSLVKALQSWPSQRAFHLAYFVHYPIVFAWARSGLSFWLVLLLSWIATEALTAMMERTRRGLYGEREESASGQKYSQGLRA